MALFKKKKKKNKNEQVEYKEQIKDQKILVDDIEEEILVEGDKEIKIKKQVQRKLEKEDDPSVLNVGNRNIKDIVAPDFDRTNDSFLKVGDKNVRTFAMKVYPPELWVGWLDKMINSDASIDTVIHITPSDSRKALQELTEKITQYQTQLSIEVDRGNISNITSLQSNIQQLYNQRIALEQNYENLFHVQIITSLYADSEKELDKESQKLQNRLKGDNIDISRMHLRQEEAYKSTLPFGESYMKDFSRNLNSGALTACFPFYNSEISHENGIQVGINLNTLTPVYIDFYDRSLINNSNVSIFGETGSGKTFFVNLLTLRSTLKQIRTVIIDPEGDYKKLTQAIDGSYINLSANSQHSINPFDIEEEHIRLADGSVKKTVNLIDKVSDIENLISVMARNVTMEQRSLASDVIMNLYREEFGINENPESLYEEDYYDEELGKMIHGKKKTMPTFSDFHDSLTRKAKEIQSESLMQLSNALLVFKRTGAYGLFDRQTSDTLTNFSDSPVITFDVSQLEEGVLRPIGMYIAMTWTWEKFVKKNPDIKKRVICDEAWMLVNSNMEGHEYTSKFLELLARRIRKRNGGLVVASQNFTEFTTSASGKAVLDNASVRMFLRQSSTTIDALQETFKLSDGERNFLLTASKGEMLIRINNDAIIAKAQPFYFEKALIDNPFEVLDKPASFEDYV